MYPQLNALERTIHVYSAYWNTPNSPDAVDFCLTSNPPEVEDPLPDNVVYIFGK